MSDIGFDISVLAEERDGVCRIPFHAVPRASVTKIVGEYDGAVKIALAAPPVDGAANKELISFIAKRLGVPKSSVSIVAGESSRRKLVAVTGISLSGLNKLR